MWYSVTIDIADDGPWRPFTDPWTEWREQPGDEIARVIANDHDLADLEWPWRVRVYEGYNRFERLLTEATGGPTADQ